MSELAESVQVVWVPGMRAPIFIFTMARSGSTLLRFMLDAHPLIGCPPEGNMPALCGNLATFLSLIEGAPLSASRGAEPPVIPEAVIAEVRESVGRWMGRYLARRGKQWYCEKSLGVAKFAYLLQRIWPDAVFICLYRHPMDVIKSGIEASPWGFTGYGFEPYIIANPGNWVNGLGTAWIDNTSVIAEAEARFPERCIRAQYEAMVSDPQAFADRLFSALGVDLVPNIDQAVFAAERERFGPADYKIWHTSRISTSSVGRGWTLPAGHLMPPVRSAIIQMCASLGYLPPDERWGRGEQPADMRVPAQDQGGTPRQEAAGPESGGPRPAVRLAAGITLAEPGFAALVGKQLSLGVSQLPEGFFSRWEPCAAETFEVIARPDGPGPQARWRVDLAAGSVTAVTSLAADSSEDDGIAWDVTAAPEAWEQIIGGLLNLSVAVRSNQLIYGDSDQAGPVMADARMGMLGELLGLASWGQARQVLITRPANPPARPAGDGPPAAGPS